MEYTQILLRPLTSEKTTSIKEAFNQVVFFVHPSANKIEVARAVEEAFKVKVSGVNIVRRKPLARKRHGKASGRISGHKKAYVTLEPGHKIEFFEGV
jgi:large subunit ribosomal protein L23